MQQPFLRSIHPRGFLSFGPETEPIELRSLNVLIGTNGSGKSNLIEAIGLLRSSAAALSAPLRGGGGVAEWIWKGAPEATASLDAVVAPPPDVPQNYRHAIGFENRNGRVELTREVVENEHPNRGHARSFLYYSFEKGRAYIASKGEKRDLRRDDVALDASILSQRREPDLYPELAWISRGYERIRIYRDWTFGRRAPFRVAQPADLPSGGLEEDLSNFALVMDRIRSNPRAYKAMLERLRHLYEGLDDFNTGVQGGGTIEVYLTEGDFRIPAGRLSDGTLRYMCLLAILCDPDPPPVACIEEPELGLHPDILPKLADLLIEASERMQLVVTTHSELIVSAMQQRPESVVVFEKHAGRTTAKRLDGKDLGEWLEEYTLGEHWMRGGLGGTRW